MALQGSAPPLFRDHDSHRLPLDKIVKRDLIISGRFGDLGPAGTNPVLTGEGLFGLPKLSNHRGGLFVLGLQKRLQRLLLRLELFILFLDLHLFELAKSAEPHVEDGFSLDFS